MATTDDTAPTIPSVPDDENEPPETSQPYVIEHQPSNLKKEAGNNIDSSEEATSPLIGTSSSVSPSTESPIPIDLNIRETRLTLWSIAYFIFSVCEFTGNSILANANATPKSAYQTWAASDFFLLIAASMLFIECNPRYILEEIKANENNLHKIFRYIIAALFAFGGILRWFALGKHNNVNCNNSHCNSYHFAQDFMATYFSFVIAIDVLNLFEMINTNQRGLRIIIYSGLIMLCSIIVISWYDYVDSIIFYNSQALRAWKTGWVFILLMLIFIFIIGILICLQKYDGLIRSDKVRKYMHLSIAIVMHIGIGLAYYSGALIFQMLLAIVALLMIIFDFMEFS